jgi:hypothetical protein
MIVADRQACGDSLGKTTEVLAHALAQRLESLKARAVAAGMEADALGTVVIHRHEHSSRSFGDPGSGHVSGPQGVDGFRNDRAVMIARPVWRAYPGRRQQIVLTH